ncbi:MAG: NAD-dependent epimerase/dehydratase family protein [Myxococcota bacterium]
MAKRILFIGGTGFMGARAVTQLVEAGHEVTVFHRGETDRTPDGTRHIHGDRSDLAAHREAFRALQPEVVVHMIAATAQEAWTARQLFEGSVGHIVLASSVDVTAAYGRLFAPTDAPLVDLPLTPNSPLRNRLHPYRTQAEAIEDPERRERVADYDKIVVESIFQASTDFAVTTLRFPMVHGPGDPQRRFGAYLTRMDAGREAILLDTQQAEWRTARAYVDDMGRVIARAATLPAEGHRTFVLGDQPTRTERAWLEALAAQVGWSGRIVTAHPLPEGLAPTVDFRQCLDVDPTAAITAFDLPAPTPLEEQLAATVADERARGPIEEDYAAEDAALASLSQDG